jgi:predicted Zn-dependent protease
MNNQTEFYTKTMANVYARQGYFAKAVEIYRHLLKHDPESRELNDLLSEVEKKFNEKQKKDREILEKLFGKWIYLQLGYNRLQKLRKFKGV